MLNVFTNYLYFAKVKFMKILKLLNDEQISEEELKNFKHRRDIRVAAFDDENKIALVHAKINKYYELPGGGVEEGETLEEGAIREAVEEIGCDVDLIGEIGIVKEYLKDKNLINETFCYLAKVKGVKGELRLNQDEIDEGMDIVWVDIHEAIRLINTNSEVSEYATALQVKYTKVRDLSFLENVNGNWI
jgi:8-oxo-dGTP diphosphatase